MFPIDGTGCHGSQFALPASELPTFYTVADAAGIALVTPQTSAGGSRPANSPNTTQDAASASLLLNFTSSCVRAGSASSRLFGDLRRLRTR